MELCGLSTEVFSLCFGCLGFLVRLHRLIFLLDSLMALVIFLGFLKLLTFICPCGNLKKLKNNSVRNPQMREVVSPQIFRGAWLGSADALVGLMPALVARKKSHAFDEAIGCGPHEKK